MGWNSAANAQAQANQQAMMLQAIAAQQQQQTLQQSQQAQQQALQQGQKVATEQYTPYSQFGQQSLNALASAMGLGGGDGYLMRQPTQAELQMDPGYAFRMREGQKALQQQMAAGGLERALLARPELFAGTFTEKLLTFALGRGVEPTDAPALRSIVRHAQADHYRFSSLVVGLVHSIPFQMRRTP